MANQIHDEDRPTAPIGMARYAHEYLEAGQLIHQQKVVEAPESFHRAGLQVLSMPAFFCTTHAIELTLKAWLRHKGVPSKTLWSKKVGHKLMTLWTMSLERNLTDVFTLDGDEESVLESLIEFNVDNRIRYIKIGYISPPPWNAVDYLATRLHAAVGPAVGWRQTRR